MVAETVDYQAVLADLKTRRARLDQLIAGIEATVMGQADTAGAVEVESGSGNGSPPIPGTIHPDTFFGLSLIEASKKFLRMARRAQHTGTIAEALSTGGLKRPTDAVLSSILVRAAKGREITKVGRGMWGLSEWYPKAPKEPEERPRPRKPASKKAAQIKAEKRPRNKAAKVKRQTAPPAEAGGRRSKGAPLDDLVMDILRQAGKSLEPKDILKQLKARGSDIAPGILGMCLYRHTKAGRIQKPVGTNVYRVVAEAA